MDLAPLLHRLDALESEREILRTIHLYGHTIGVGNEDGWLDCFLDDGVFEVQRRDFGIGSELSHPHPDQRRAENGAAVVYRGRTGLRSFISRHPHPPVRYHKHNVLDTVITLDGDEAGAVSFFIRLDAGRDGAPHVTAFGRYTDRLRRCPDGRWRFVHRFCAVESRGPDPF